MERIQFLFDAWLLQSLYIFIYFFTSLSSCDLFYKPELINFLLFGLCIVNYVIL
jgi:hypothetical protein